MVTRDFRVLLGSLVVTSKLVTTCLLVVLCFLVVTCDLVVTSTILVVWPGVDLALGKFVVTGTSVMTGLVGLSVVSCGVVGRVGLVVTVGLVTFPVVLLVTRRSVVRPRVVILSGTTVVFTRGLRVVLDFPVVTSGLVVTSLPLVVRLEVDAVLDGSVVAVGLLVLILAVEYTLVVASPAAVVGVIVVTTCFEQLPSVFSLYPTTQSQALFVHAEFESPQSLDEVQCVDDDTDMSEALKDTPFVAAVADIFATSADLKAEVSSLNVTDGVARRLRDDGFMVIAAVYADFTAVLVTVCSPSESATAMYEEPSCDFTELVTDDDTALSRSVKSG